MVIIMGPGKIIKFEEKKQVWSEYKLEDDSILRIRFILIAIDRLEEDEKGFPIFGIDGKNIVAAIVNEEDKGSV